MHRDALKKQKGIILDKFVLQLPKWQGELLFSKGTLMFVGVILLLIVGTLFCFWGYKYFRTVLFLGIGVVVCYGSYLLVEPMTANLVIRMFVTVSLTFLGMCFVYFLQHELGFNTLGLSAGQTENQECAREAYLSVCGAAWRGSSRIDNLRLYLA